MLKSSPIQATGLVRAMGLMPRSRMLMLAGVSALALMAATPRVEARSLGGGLSAATSAPAAALVAAQAAALRSAQQANVSIRRATQALEGMRQIQLQARAAASQGAIPNGLAVGGLEPDSGLNGSTALASWTGIAGLVEVRAGERATVNILQTQSKAILNWKTFNVGSGTAVNFNQGGTDWVALNRIDDPSGQPSKILGQINAPGSVYLINRNGIIFGAGSQVNVTGLIASSLDVGALGMTRQQRDQFFLNSGIGTGTGLSFSISSTPDGNDANTDAVGRDIQVEAGASITTALNTQDSPGFVYLFGGNVNNSGTITSPAGEVAMVAARTIALTPGAYRSGVLQKDPLSTTNGDVIFRGTGFNFSQYSSSYTAAGVPNGKYLVDPVTGIAVTGIVKQGGLVETPRGTALLAGDKIFMGGVISADTGVIRNSSVLLDATTSVNVSGTISIQPFENGETLPFLNGAATLNTSSNVQAFIPGLVFMGGYDVTVDRTGLISAPSATVKLQATGVAASLDSNVIPQRVLLAPGATIDVAGLQNVELPASYNFIAYNPRGTEFADTPLQRDSVLFGKTLWIDIRASGIRSDGTTWLGTPLGNANGFVNNAPQSIDVLMTRGGTVTLTTDTNSSSSSRDVVLQQGSLINVAGGSVKYLPGSVPVTILIGADGRRYSMAKADPNMIYVAVAGQFTVNHPHWGVTETYSSGGTRYESGYIEGRDAGGISVTTVNPVLAGDFLFGSISGERQIGNGVKASGTLNGAPSQSTPYELPSQGYLALTTAASVVIGNGNGAALPEKFTDTTPLPPVAFDPIPTDLYKSNAPFRTDLSAAVLSGYNLSALIITASDITLTKGSEIDVALGGSVVLKTAGAMDLQGTIVAHSGKITLNTDNFGLAASSTGQNIGLKISLTPSGKNNIADIRIGGVLDTSGLWVNDNGATSPGLATGKAFTDGGNISVSTNYSGDTHDVTGSIILSAASVLDASSGGYVGVNGKVVTSAYQVPSGKGGNITLAVYQGISFANAQPDTPQASEGNEKYANVLIDPASVLRSYGFTRNGELLIAAPLAIQIGGQPNTAANLWLPTSLFAAGGFSKYTIQSVADGRLSRNPIIGNLITRNTTSITLAANETLNLRQRNFSLQGVNLSDLPTGTDVGRALPVVTLADDQRAPTSLMLGSDYILLDTGSKIITDSAASASVSLRGTQNAPSTALPISYGTATSALLLGQIVSHGGTVNVVAKHIWLGPKAGIDVSGAFVANSTFGQVGSDPVSGKLLNGGKVNLTFDAGNLNSASSSLTSYLIGEVGASIDVSGARATLQGIGSSDPVESWSDGGTLNIATRTLLWDGTFSAKAGDARGNDGTLVLGGGQVVLAQSVTTMVAGGTDMHTALGLVSTPTGARTLGDAVDSKLAAFTTATNGTGNVNVTVDKLAEFGTIYLYSANDAKPAQYFSTLNDPSVTLHTTAPTALTLKTVGQIDWGVSQRLYLGAQAIVANTPSSTSTVSITAPYVLLTTYNNQNSTTQSSTAAVPGSGTLAINANAIDVESAVFSGYATVNLNSKGDIRFSTPHFFEADPKVVTDTNPFQFTGSINTLANLSLQAQRIYPVTKVDFTITAPNVTFSAPAGSNTDIPLSAGGSVTVVATTITQNGNLFAPLGKITLGDATAQTVKLGAGSLTSVALDKTVPFGTTEDGVGWFYNDSTHPLTLSPGATTFLPTKVITLNGQNVTLQSTSTVDVSGGGDLQANEFIAGKGGSIDTLTSKANQTVYALLPSNSAAVAAFDIDFIYRLGDSQPLAGRQVYLAGGNGIAAGTYTLLPAHYATLPGALRVVDKGSALANPRLAGVTLPDRTQIIGGYYTQSTKPGGRSSGTELFAVQTNDVWRQYSEIDGISANSYFYAKSVHDGVNVPYLPVDAGRLAISAQNTLTMAATARSAAAGSGRPGQLDLSANQIALVAPGQTAPTGYVGIDVTQINGFGSVLIGGLRTDQADGTTLITAVASQVLADTRGFELAAPEIILVATPTVPTSTLSQTFKLVPTGIGATTTFNFSLGNVVSGAADADTGNIAISDGSVIHSTGLTGNTFARKYVLPSSSAAALAAALGGSLDSTGTVITGASINKLQNNDPTVQALLRNYSGSSNFGAMMALTSDPLLSFANLSGTSNASLTINFTGTVSGAPVTVTGTLALPGGNGNNTGTISIGANADVRGQSLTLNATRITQVVTPAKTTAAFNLDPTARFDAARINLVAQNFGFGTGAASTAAVALTSAAFDRLAAGRILSLQALGGGIAFYGDVALDSQRQSRGLIFDTSFLTGQGGTVSIGSGGTVTLQNSGQSGATSRPLTAGTSLTLNADEVDLGGGSQTIAGFGNVAFNADTRVFVKNSGSLQLGLNNQDAAGNYTDQVDLAVTTPNLLVGAKTSSGAGTGSQFLLSTHGRVTVARPAGSVGRAPSTTTQNGGYLQIEAKSFALSSAIQVQAGTLVIHTTGSDSAGYGIRLDGGAYIAAGGFKQSFFDVDQYLPGGKVTFTADTGKIFTAASSTAADGSIIPPGTIDVAQPIGASGNLGLGYGGEVNITATAGNAELNGVVNGAGAAGHGGIFRLDVRAIDSLDTLADKLLAGGMTGGIDVHTRQGNMTLSQGHTLKAHIISLIADATTPDSANGNLTIAGTIDARGEDVATSDGANQAGGQVGLWGANSVRLSLTGLIRASTTHADERGGDVIIGVGWKAQWDPVNKFGGINLQVGSQIDVSGGSKGGLSGGTVTLRAPNDGNNDVKIQQIGSTIAGARAVNIEDYIAFDTTNSGNGIDGSRLIASNGTAVFWDGIIDPAGWYNTNAGTLVNGSFSGVSGWKLNVTAGSGYTSVPTLTFASTGGIPTVVASLKVVTLSVTAGGEYSSVPSVTLGAPNSSGLANGGTQAQATVNAGLKSITVTNGPSGISNNAPVTISGGTSGTAASGTAIVDSNGVLTGVTITAAGSNYAGAPVTLTVGGKTLTTGISATFKINAVTFTAGEGYTGVPAITVTGGKTTTAATFNLSMGVAATVTSNATAAYLMPGTLTFTAGAGGTGASITLTTSTAISGTITGGTGVFTPSLGMTGFTYLDSNGLTNGRGLATFTPTVNTAHSLFYTDVLKNYVQGNWTYTNPDTGVVSSYGFSGAQNRLGSYVMPNGAAGNAHVQPGLDLINSSTSKNNGDITVASNWNLAAGSAFKSNGTALTATDTYNFADNYIKFIYRLGLEPGTLNLRAIRDVNINASISDGFFQFRNYAGDASYATTLLNYIKSGQERSIGSYPFSNINNFDYYLNGVTVQVALYGVTTNATLTPNGYSPAGSALESADVFPENLSICISTCGTTTKPISVQYPGSWSYRVTAGADLASANPNATKSLATFGDSALVSNKGHGNVSVSSHESYNQSAVSVSSTAVLTLANALVNLPTMLRTGTGSIDIAAARNLELKDQFAPGVIYTAGVNTILLNSDPQLSIASIGGTNTLVAGNALGFLQPQILLANAKNPVYGPANAAAFPEMGGDITIAVQQDVIGFQDVKNPAQTLTTGSFAQFYTPWLFSTAQIGLPTSSNDILTLGAGVFTPTSTRMTEQSAWWIQFGSFDQGVMSVGGNVTLAAGRDVRDFSVSLPTTGRVSGGLSQTWNGQLNTPVPHVYGSGNMTVSVGRALASGTFYEGSGHASIQVRGSVTGDWQYNPATTAATSIPASFTGPANPMLALDSGQIALTAGGSVALAGIVNPAALRYQLQPAFGTGNAPTSASGTKYVMQTYGQDSSVRLFAAGGDITLANFTSSTTTSAVAKLYPSSLSAVAFTGSITLNDNVVLADSLNGGLDLLAAANITLNTGLTTGTSLLDAAFNAYAPNNGLYGSSSKSLLAHNGDHGVNHLYAVTGTIKSTGFGQTFQSNRPVAVQAGIDILDFNMTAQNVNPDAVSSLIAGRDISFTGLNNSGGLQIAGPGFLLVEAGRDLGPFLPLANDTATNAKVAEGIISLGNGAIIGNSSFAPPKRVLKRNFLLPDTGASIVAMFGVAKGVNYQGVIDGYIDPTRSNDFSNYLSNFAAFLVKSGKASYAPNSNALLVLNDIAGLELPLFNSLDAATQQVFLTQINFDSPAHHGAELHNFLLGKQFDLNKVYWPVFNGLSNTLQDLFVVDLFTAHLKAIGDTNNANYRKYQVEYQMIDTLFPSAFGYTKNELGAGANGANTLVRTGNLDMLHSTIQTQKGGDISILGPGGSILVGSVATEPNTNLKPSYLGLLTLAGGGINTFTDADVLVNASRVMTWFGGDILMWSSNGDIDAGRGARTTLSFPPLKVNFNPDDIETVDLAGLVSGAGIAVLQTQSFANKSDAFLLAPRGTVDAGDAGIRVSGNLSIIAVRVANADNIQVQGKTSGVPTVEAPNVAGLTSANNTAGTGAKTMTPTADKPADRPSVIIVEVVGYGGGDGTDANPPRPEKKKQTDDRQGYNPNGNVRVLGYSTLGESEMIGLTEKEKQAIRN